MSDRSQGCQGYGPKDRSWISRSLIIDHQLLKDFYQDFLNKPGKATRGCDMAVYVCASPAAFKSSFCHSAEQSHFVPPPTLMFYSYTILFVFGSRQRRNQTGSANQA